MHIFNDNKRVSPIYHRALSLTISKDFASQQYGRISQVQQQDSEQTNPRRELLAIETAAKQEKIIKSHGQTHFKTQMMEKFFASLTTQVNKEFDNTENLYHNVLHIEDAAPSILEILSVKAASLKRIIPLANSLNWLADELVNLVNKPQYRKRADVQVTNSNLAISYIGLDNLKLVMPTFMLKHWLPASTSPFPLMKRKLWNNGLSVALAASVLAEEEGVDTFTAFSAGMLSNIGYLAVTRCFLQTYHELHKEELQQAYENKDKKLYDALIDFTLSPELILEQLIARNGKIAADMVELMRFDRLQITEAVFDLGYTSTFNNMCAVAKIVAKAKAYITFRSLAKEELISNAEAKALLSSVNSTPQNIALLKSNDIDHIKLHFS